MLGVTSLTVLSFIVLLFCSHQALSLKSEHSDQLRNSDKFYPYDFTSPESALITQRSEQAILRALNAPSIREFIDALGPVCWIHDRPDLKTSRRLLAKHDELKSGSAATDVVQDEPVVDLDTLCRALSPVNISPESPVLVQEDLAGNSPAIL